MTTEVYYRDRRTNRVVKETIHHEAFLRWLYEDAIGSKCWSLLLNHKAIHELHAKTKRAAKSREQIAQFAAAHSIDVEEIELPLSDYCSFNDFFTRKLKPGKRPFEQETHFFCSPADAKVLVYPHPQAEQKFWIKGATSTISDLLDSRVNAEPYRGGSVLIARLAPYDYHRFHFPDSGTVHQTHKIRGHYHSVNPIALAQVPDVYCRNRRSITEFWSDHFGRIACVEVGALMVGSIVQTHVPGRVERGQEKGYFQFGGSTIVLLFEPNKICFDDDLIRDSANHLEVHVLAGSKIGQQAAFSC